MIVKKISVIYETLQGTLYYVGQMRSCVIGVTKVLIHAYTGNKDTHGINSMRLAEVWMDEYKRLFYMHRRDLLVMRVCTHACVCTSLCVMYS